MTAVELIDKSNIERITLLPGNFKVLLQNDDVKACGIKQDKNADDYIAVAVFSITPGLKIIINHIYVGVEFRHMELGDELLAFIENEAKAVNANSVNVFVNPEYVDDEGYMHLRDYFSYRMYFPTVAKYEVIRQKLGAIIESDIYNNIIRKQSTTVYSLQSGHVQSCDNYKADFYDSSNDPLYGSVLRNGYDPFLSKAIIKDNRIIAILFALSDGASIYIANITNLDANSPANVLALLHAFLEDAHMYYPDDSYIWSCNLTNKGKIKNLFGKIAAGDIESIGYPQLVKDCR